MALTANQDWLYKQMSGKNVDLGSEEQFAQAMQDESNRQWVYEQAGKMGIDLGTPEQFASAMLPTDAAQTGGVSGGSLLSEQEELARQNAIQGVTNDPNHPFVEKRPSFWQSIGGHNPYPISATTDIQGRSRQQQQEAAVQDAARAQAEWESMLAPYKEQFEAQWKQDAPVLDEVWNKANERAKAAAENVQRNKPQQVNLPSVMGGGFGNIGYSLIASREANKQNSPEAIIEAFERELDNKYQSKDVKGDIQLAQEMGATIDEYQLYKRFVEDKIAERFVGHNIPQDKLDYFARKFIQGNLIAQLASLYTQSPQSRQYAMQGTQQYEQANPGWATKGVAIGAEVANVVADPLMWIMPGVGEAAGRGIVNAAGRRLASVGLSDAAGAAERAAMQRGLLRTAQRLTSGGVMMAGIDTGHTLVGDLYQTGEVNWSNLATAPIRGALTGMAFAGGGALGERVQKAVGDVFGRDLGLVAGRATHFAAGTNIMVGSSVASYILQGGSPDDIDWGIEYANAAAMQLFFDIQGGLKTASKAKGFGNAWKAMRQDPMAHTLTIEEIEQFNAVGIEGNDAYTILKNLNGGKEFTSLEEYYKVLNDISADERIDTQAKYKLASLLYGKVDAHVSPIYVGDVEAVADGYVVKTYDNGGMTYETRKFDTQRAADVYRARQHDATRNNMLEWVEGIIRTRGFAEKMQEVTDGAIDKTIENYPQLSREDAYRVLSADEGSLTPIERAIRGQMEKYLAEDIKGSDILKDVREQVAREQGVSIDDLSNLLSREYSRLSAKDKTVFENYLDRLNEYMPRNNDRTERRAIGEGGGLGPNPPEETTPLSPAAAEHQRAVDEVTQAVKERTHGNGYIYPVAMPGNAEKTGYIVGEVVPVIDESDPEQLRIENDDIVTVKWSDGTVTQERARDLDLTGAPMMAQQAVDIEVENQMYAYTQQRIQNGEQPVLMRNGEGILEGFFPTEGGLLEDQNGVQYTPEQLAEQGWQETKPVLFVNDTQQIAALDNGDGTYTQVDALGNPIAEPMSAEAFRDQGFAMVPLEEEQPKSQAPVEAPVVEQAPVETQAPEVQQPEVQEPAAPVVPNIETMSAADYAGAAVEYMGSREYVDEYLDGEIKKVQQQLGVANRKKVGNVTDMADFKAKKDAIEAEKKALQARLDKLKEAREKAKSYLTITEREQRAQAEAERRAAEEAARIAREQAAAAEAARLEQERIDRELKKGVPDFSEDNDRDARNRGFHVLNGQVIHRQEPLQPLATGKAVTVQFAKGQNGAAEAHHVLIPVSMAQPSHINGQRNPAFFISEAQPKDRRDQVSKVTSDMMAQNIHPDEIVEGATAYVGAPVLNGRGEAVQGNNRLDALIKMYQSHPESVAKYKQYLIDNAAALGYTETDIETIRNNDVIDVRMLDNVTDEQAIQLGQKKATDLETGGVQLIDPQVTANQLGDRIQRFSEILLRSEDDEATLADLTLRNGRPALEFLQKLGIISDAQMQSAFDSRGNLTAEAKAALQGVLKQVLFQNADSDNLPIMFDDIPVTAQKAILQTIVRDLQSPEESRLVPDIQEAIGALYRALHQSAEVKNGRNEQEIRAAMRSWALQMQFPSDFDAENFVPSEIFSNFALELATLFKYGKQTEIAKALNAYYDAVQGTTGGLFGDTPAIPYKEAIKQIFGIDYKSVDEARREKHRKELTDYLNTIADEAHPFELYGNDNFIDLLIQLGTSPRKIEYVRNQLANGKTFDGFTIKNKLYLNTDGLDTTEKARSKYIHERQHLLTTKEQIERVMRAASREELDVLVEVLSQSGGAYSNESHDVLADEFISYSMEEAYAVESDEELESILRAAGANDELINIIKSINNEQRENDERLGQSERLGNARRPADVRTDSQGHSPQNGRDQGKEPGVLEQTGAGTTERGGLGGRTGGEDRGSTEGAGLSEVGSEEVSGEKAGGAGDNAGIAGENQGSSGVGQERGLGEVTATPTEDNAHLSDNKSAFVAPQMPIDTQTNAQKQSKAPSEEEQQQAAQYLNEALQEVISKSGDKLPQNITIDENTIEDIPDSVEMTARLLIDGKPSDFSVTIFDQSLGARGGFDPVNMVKFYPREELDKWDWDLADRLAEEFNKTRTQESGLATVMDESDAVYFFNMQAALDFAEKARQEIAPTDNRETSETRATETEIGGALVDRLGDIGVSVSTDLDANRAALKAAKADKSDAGAIHYYKTPSGQQYGFSYKGRIYLDPTKIDAELPIHEYGHLWAEAMRRISPESWRSVVDTIKADQASWDFVRALRPELTDENEIAEEVIATFSGKRGAERLRAEYKKMHGKDADYKSKWGNIFRNISKAIQDFWKAVGDFLNIKYQSAEQIYDQVLKDFVDNMNPYQKVRDFLRARDAEYIQAAESGDIQKATNIFYDALRENIGNGITPYMSVGTYLQFKRLAKGVKTRDAAIIREAAEKIAPLIPDNAVLVPTPSHTGRATDMLDLANAIAEITGSEVADILRSAPRESQYQAKKETGTPMASQQLGIMMEGTIPADKTAIVIDNVVDSGNTAEACIQALGKGVVVTMADSAEQYRHAASLRSAAPILRDKDGNIVPLTKRFNLNGSRYLGRRMYLRPDDPRFAISGTQVIPVGEKTLVGLHNISAEKLRKAIKMGGLANPSTAVINIASQNHEQYGDISLIMPSRLVDSDTGRNAGTFTGDIWSPTYPSVERIMSDKGDDAYYAAITKAFGDNEARRPILSRAKLDFDDYLDSGNIRAGLAYWYLLEKGIEPGDVYFNSGISDDIKERFRPLYDKGILDLTKEDYRTLLSLIAEQQGKTAEDMLQDAQESKARYQQTIDDPEAKQFYKKIAQQAIDEIDLYGVRYNVLSNGYHAMERAIRNDGKIDLDSTLIAAQDIVQTQYQADFDKWLSDMDKRFDIKEVLFEDYDRDGNRIYKPHTLANASRMMNKEDLQNAGDHSGLGATRGQLVERMETLADIRANKERLRPGAEEDFETEEWNKMQDEWFNKVLNPLSEMQKISDNPFSQVGYAETRLQEALRTKDPIATLNKEYRYHIDKDSQWAKDLADMVERVKNLPTKYFETKFRRPVYLNEFANAVVPNDLPQDLRAGLESAGLRLFSYDPNAQGSRRDATLKATEADGIRFSINGNHRSSRGTMTGFNGMQSPVFADIKDQYLREMADIKDKAIKDSTFMQAPNGKPSRLNERQWLQVRTENFKRWFGDWQNDPENASKVLDENGEPMVVYHRTNNKFTQFDPDRAREQSGWPTADFGFYFSNVNERGHYGRKSMPVFLNIRNPREIDVDYYADFDYNYKHADPEEMRKDNDGLQINIGRLILDEKATKVFVTPNPNQIKSATNNNGDFSEENDDIRFSISGNTRTRYAEEMESIKNEAVNNGTFMQAPNGKPTNLDERQWLQVRLRSFKRWFGDWENDPKNASKSLDENGEPMVVVHTTPANFTTFKRGERAGLSGKGIYFAVPGEGVPSYGGNRIDAFLNVRNPLTSELIRTDQYKSINNDGRSAIDPNVYENYPEFDGVMVRRDEITVKDPNQIKSAIDNDGSFSEENDDIRFAISNQNNDIFYSNAERAVEGIKQEKATPEQWRAMIEKNGGLKAGEDKWIGLSDWLAQQRPTVTPQANETRSQFVERAAAENKRFTLSKQDLLDYIRANKIQIEEVEYDENEYDVLYLERKDEFKRYYDEAVEAGEEEPQDVAWQRMIDEYGDDFELAYWAQGDELMRDNDSDYAQWEDDAEGYPRNINETRLTYTTQGLENKREIALTVPTIESWNEDDEIHFGDAGEGRAIAWVRFGDATDEQGNKTLVIDEIQSKRHQEGREKGYKATPTEEEYKEIIRREKVANSLRGDKYDFEREMKVKYGSFDFEDIFKSQMTDAERDEWRQYDHDVDEAEAELHELKDRFPYDPSTPPVAPFEKNWHELAMKRILRFAAENGYDKVAWTTGDQQAARYNIGNHVDGIDANPFMAGVTPDIDYDGTQILIYTDGATLEMDVDKDGNVVKGYESASMEYEGKNISDIVGKEIARKLLTGEEVKLRGEDFRIGGEGMRGFYDDILPRFMQKYGKKWGVQVGEVTMPQLEDGYQTMHAIDINDAMRESVMEGQPMFSISGRGVNGTMKPQEGETRSQYIARVAETVKSMTPRNTTIDDAIRFSITVNHNSPYLLKRADGAFVDPETGERLGFDHRFMGKGEGGQAHGWGSYFSVNDIRSYGEGYGFSLRDIKDAFNTSRWQSFGVGDAFDVAKGYLLEAHSEKAPSLRKWLEDRLAQKQELLKNYEGKVANTAEEDLMVFRAEADVQYIPALLRDMVNDIDTRNRHHYDVEIPDNDGTNYLDEIKTLPKPLRRKIAAAVRELPGKPMPSVKYVNYTGGWRQLADMIERNQWAYLEIRDRLVQAFGSKLTDEKRLSDMMHDIGFVGIHYDGRRDGECYVIFNPDDAVITNHIRFSVTGGKSVLPKTTDASQVEHPMRSTYNTNGDIVGDDQIRFSVNNPSTLSRSETVTKALVQQANNNYNIMQSALKKVTADLKGIRAAMRMQSDYDRKVVDSLLNLYNTLLQENGVWAQYMPDTTRRIATQIVHAIGKQNITEEVNTIMDHMVYAQAKAAQRQWDKLRQTPIDKINISGVVMQGKVALEGQHALKAMNDALQANMTIEQIEEQINQLMDMEDNATDESLKTQYKGQWIGLTIAEQHLERLQHLQEERQQLNLELQSTRSNKALKPAARQQLVENIKQAMRDNYIEQAEAYTRSTQDLSEYVNTQEGRAKDFIRRQDANRDKIRSYAQRDLEGLATNPNRNRTRGNIARQIWDAFASPIRDLQSLLRLTGLHAPDGEGYLYNHFMRNWMDGADKERLGIVNASKTLDAKISELTHGKYKTWEEAARKINDASHNMFPVMSSNGVDGKDQPVIEEILLNAGNALYIYAVNKQIDGKMKLSSHNITDEDVKALVDAVREQFGQEIIDVVDWIQSEYFSQLRNRYNPTHEALFGAPIDAIENYFPLRLNPLERQQNEDLSEPDTDAARLLAGTSTGSIKRRKRNSIGIDIRNADFFQEVIRHISQMERWNAFAQWNRDANILFSDINFRNRIKGMKGTIYGEGDKLYNYMKDAFRVAIGTYKPKTDTFSEITLNMAKGVTSAKINFRIFTALKQIASFPAFFTYMQDGVFVGSYLRNWLKPHETMKWAKENLPNFEKRVSKRDMGDMRLMQRSTDWQWNKRILEWSSKYGMFFNVFFDTLTCATGARAVYDSRLAEYLKKGYPQEQAEQRARQDAEQAFNTSQQSSEGAFMSAVQMDRNLVTAALTVFRTSPIQYTRNFFYHTRNLLRKFGRGSKEEQIAFRMGQYKNDGLNDEQARKAAEKDYNKSLRQDIVGFVVYGALLNILWRLVGQAPYLFFGDDDDKKKKILEDATTGGALVSPITGLIGGSYIESALDGNGLITSLFAPELPFTQDAKRAEQYLQNNKYAEFANQALSVAMQSGTGFDPQTAGDMIQRIVTTIDSEEELDAAEQALRISQALLSIPQSQYEQQLIDRVVADESEYDAALADYIRYQKVHTAPLTWWLRGEESDEKAEENAENRFDRLLNERDALHNPEEE